MIKQHMMRTFGLAIGLFLGGAALANVNSVSGTAQPATLTPSSLGAVTLRWQLSVANAVGAAPQGVSALRGEVLSPDGRSLMTLPNTLQQTGSGSMTLTESVSIAPTAVRSWLSAGYQRVIVQRTFTPVIGSAATGRIIISLTDSQSPGTGLLPGASTTQSQLLDARTPTAGLVIRNLELRFQESLAAKEVVEPMERLRAELRISHSGNGIFEGEWQVAEPGSTEGLPLYRPLLRVRQALTGQQLSVLLSPELPTRVSGRYILRFCGIDPAATTASERANLCSTPQTTIATVYQVLAGSSNALETIHILAPLTQAVTRTTRFEWQPVSGTVVYQMQIFSRNQDTSAPTFVTGMLLPQEQSDMSLSALMSQQLKTGGRYLWRVNALDESGRVIGRSDEKTFIYSTE